MGEAVTVMPAMLLLPTPTHPFIPEHSRSMAPALTCILPPRKPFSTDPNLGAGHEAAVTLPGPVSTLRTLPPQPGEHSRPPWLRRQLLSIMGIVLLGISVNNDSQEIPARLTVCGGVQYSFINNYVM